MLKRKLSLVFILFFSCFAALAQTKQITGKILSSDDNTALPGVTVSVKGTSVKTVTNEQGTFSIYANKGTTLIFTYTGYQEKLVTINEPAFLAISLTPKISALEEVVVIGYGTSPQRDLTGSISKVDFSKQVNSTVTPSFEAGLQGRALGVQITQSNGIPGSAVRVRVRGQSSFTGSGDPLYVVDGVPIYSGDLSSPDGSFNTVRASNGNVLSTINPADIESVEVLKDAAASGIYGARAANGVIVITTKRGKAGKTQFNAAYSLGQSEATNKLELISSQQWWELYNEARVNDGDLPRDPS